MITINLVHPAYASCSACDRPMQQAMEAALMRPLTYYEVILEPSSNYRQKLPFCEQCLAKLQDAIEECWKL